MSVLLGCGLVLLDDGADAVCCAGLPIRLTGLFEELDRIIVATGSDSTHDLAFDVDVAQRLDDALMRRQRLIIDDEPANAPDCRVITFAINSIDVKPLADLSDDCLAVIVDR